MERSFYNEDFEELIKQKADQYKMYPSDKVWKGIHGSMHPRRRWYWFGFFLILSGAGYYTFNVLLIPSPIKQIAKAPLTSTANTDKEKDEHIRQAIIVPFTTQVKKSKATTDSNAEENTAQEETIVHIPPIADNSAIPIAPQEQPAATADESSERAVTSSHIKSLEGPAMIEVKAPPANTTPIVADKAASEDAHQSVTWEHYAPFEFKLPQLKRLSWQLAFSPTKNFRQLRTGSGAFAAKDGQGPVAPVINGNPTDLLNHDPAFGFELGSHLVYAISRNFSVKAGIQFNYSRYNIQAYSSYSVERATIALDNNPSGFHSDSVTSYTRLQNFGGDNVQKLHNQYFQLSAPIGIELRVLGQRKLQFRIGGTIQPTYLVNRNTYLITTDYKNYTEAPSLVRRWNVNTGLEASLSYQTAGGLRWQLGPQFRYQLFSSYIREYPIREYLMEYGLKLAVSKVIR